MILRQILLTLILAFSSRAQSNSADGDQWKNVPVPDSPDKIEALAGKWDIRCAQKGCLMFTDVLRGDPDHPADVKHPEYLTIAVAIDRQTKKADYIAFHVPPNADREDGVFIAFVRDKQLANGKWDSEFEKDTTSRLPFVSCDEESCVARVKSGLVEEGPETHKMDLLEKFLDSNQILFLYRRDGQSYRTIKALFPFQRAYKQLLETELKDSSIQK